MHSWWRPTRLAFALAACSVVTAACAASGDLDVAEPAPATPTPTEAAEQSEPAAGADAGSEPTATPTPEPNPPGRAELPDDLTLEPGDRIAVQTVDGQLITMRPDGTNPVPLTSGDDGTTVSQVTWSPDANRLAWVAAGSGGADPRVRAARFDGTQWSDTAIAGVAFYLAWDPTGTRVATLGSGASGFELGVVDLGEEPGFDVIDRGSPFWFSWSPDADGFLVHASVLRLDFVPLDGPTRVLEDRPGAFQTPVWMAGPIPLLYADERDGEDFLVVAGQDGTGRRPLISYDGYLQFVVSPQSGFIALQVLDEALAPVPELITASFQTDPDDPFLDIVDPIERDQLVLMATFGGDPVLLYPSPFITEPDPVRAFYWSPDGNRLAWLVETDPGDGDCASESIELEWQFWDNGLLTDGPRFRPTATFACEYLPYFDQYGQSSTYWSPDGSQLVYAGTDTQTGQRGIHVVPVGSFANGMFVGTGDHAVWSPTTAGSGAASAV